ncbi:MAG TPA: hypothetical protein VGB97_02140 [Candidatus Paceibacterota bacterium]|jgi:hypothetical protein
MNKYVILVVLCAALLGVFLLNKNWSGNDTTNYEGAPASSSVMSVIDLKPGDISGGMRVVSIEPYNKEFGPLASNNAKAEFSGTAVIEGEYNYYFSELGGDWWLSFSASSTSSGLPAVEERSPGFSVINQEEALRLLKITPQIAAKGAARVTVQNYTLESYPSEVSDKSTIISVE